MLTYIRVSLFLFLSSFLCVPENGYSQGCRTMESHEKLLQNHPSFAENQEELERITQSKLSGEKQTKITSLVTIPVVVHVLYHVTQENIPDAQILSQIQALNEDFSKGNADASLIPASFSIVAANTNIQFCLAKRTPDGDPTTGITRSFTPFQSFVDSYDDPNEPHKFSKSIEDYLQDKGISKKRMKSKGFGESHPIAPNENEDGTDNPGNRYLNRRAEVVIEE